MSDAVECLVATADRRHVRGLAPLDHDHLDAEPARCGNLAVGGAAAAVLGDDHIDLPAPEQRGFIGFRKGTGRQDRLLVGQIKRRRHRIDAADDVAVLRRDLEVESFLSTYRQEDAASPITERADGLDNAIDSSPAVARQGHPFRSAEGDKRNAGSLRCFRGVVRNACGKRVRRIDQQRDIFVMQEMRQPIGAAKAADARLDRLRPRVRGAAGQRDGGVVADIFGQAAREFACLGGATQNQNTRFFHG